MSNKPLKEGDDVVLYKVHLGGDSGPGDEPPQPGELHDGDAQAGQVTNQLSAKTLVDNFVKGFQSLGSGNDDISGVLRGIHSHVIQNIHILEHLPAAVSIQGLLSLVECLSDIDAGQERSKPLFSRFSLSNCFLDDLDSLNISHSFANITKYSSVL